MECVRRFDFSLRFRFFFVSLFVAVSLLKMCAVAVFLKRSACGKGGISRSPYRSEDSVCQRLASTTGWWDDGYGAIGLDDSTQKIARMSPTM